MPGRAGAALTKPGRTSRAAQDGRSAPRSARTPSNDSARRSAPGGSTGGSTSPWKKLAQRINPIVAGWMQYYGRFYRSALYPLLMRINAYLVRWLRNKYKQFRAKRKANAAFQRAAKRRPGMFAQWRWTSSPSLAW
ncbi:group II intron maturase-specific domain-containing protein [Streptomyces sp. NPDC002845]